MKLGVCYYPEHWPEADWAEDAWMMRELGLSLVRIGEFAWSRLEPEPGRFDWAWLDRAIEILHAEGLGIILGTPTATPPKWLVDMYPDILPQDEHGRPRRFGSRRHYCFSSQTYRREGARITDALARRYGQHPAIAIWQTDNEFGHHGSDESFSPDAHVAFRQWLEARYGTIEVLNAAWGTVFWSQEYRNFGEVDLPGAAVTEANPSHFLDFRRFNSDQMVSFHAEQAAIIRRHSPDRPVTHNFIGDFIRLNHHDIGKHLDIATWDSYPIGLLSEGRFSPEEKSRWLRQGHPDFAAFNHDVYRGTAPEWAVMEQQPGPVNWARHNAAPAPGMVRLWTWEAFAHGARFVSYFRWRQLPFAQEQTHAGLLRWDRAPQPVMEEIGAVANEMEALGDIAFERADVAIVLDYPSLWHHEIQPQGRRGAAIDLCRTLYTGLRKLGLDVDIVPATADFSGYKLVVLPSPSILPDGMGARLKDSGAVVLATALTGCRTEAGHLPPRPDLGPLPELLPMRMIRFESLAPPITLKVRTESMMYSAGRWLETLESEAQVRARFDTGAPAWISHGRAHYVATWPDEPLLNDILLSLCAEAGLTVRRTGPDIRLRRAGGLQFAFNYGPNTVDLTTFGAPSEAAAYKLGGRHLSLGGVAAWPV
ncbi:MAG: beta-galactosidase [Hyphomonas sp.]|nr:beta-galactosidase [Hyphomonas sp.]